MGAWSLRNCSVYDALKLETLRKVAAALGIPLTIGLGKEAVRIPVEKIRVKVKA